MEAPVEGDWIGISETPLPLQVAYEHVVVPSCGGVVTFVGTVRDFSEGRDDVSGLEYEAYREQVAPRLEAIASAARREWPEIGRLVMLHRVGRLDVRDAAVVVCVSTPHRAEAFDAARYLIDTLKETVPIWKKEIWAGGSAWSEGCSEISDVAEHSHRDGDLMPISHKAAP